MYAGLHERTYAVCCCCWLSPSGKPCWERRCGWYSRLLEQFRTAGQKQRFQHQASTTHVRMSEAAIASVLKVYAWLMNSMRAYHCYVWSCMRASPSKSAVLQACSFSMEDLQSFHRRLIWLEVRSSAALRVSALQIFLLPSVLFNKYLAIWGLSVKRAESGCYQFW